VSKNKVIPQMFDVRPVDKTGDLDWKKINGIGQSGQIGKNEKQEEYVQYSYEYLAQLKRQEEEIKNKQLEVERMLLAQQEYERQLQFETEKQRMEELRKQEEERLLQQQLKFEQELRERAEAERVRQEEERIRQQQEQIRLEEIAKREELKKQEEERIRQEQLRLAEEIRLRAQQQRLEQERLLLEQQQKEELRIQEEQRRFAEQQRLIAEAERKRQFEIEQQQRRQEQLRLAEYQRIKLERQQQEQIRLQEELKRQAEADRILEIQRQAEIQRQEEQRILQQQKTTEEFERQQQARIQEEIAIKKQKEQEFEQLLQRQQAEETLRIQKELIKQEEERIKQEELVKKSEADKIKKNKNANDQKFSFSDLFFSPRNYWGLNFKKSAWAFATTMVLIVAGIGGASFASKGFNIKGKVLGVSQDGYANLTTAMKNVADQNFNGSSIEFDKAYDNFAQASSDLDELGGVLIGATRYIPFASSLSSGKNMAEAGKHISAAGKSLNEVVKIASSFKNPLENDQSKVSLLDMFQQTQQNVSSARVELIAAQENIDKVNVSDLPEDKRQKFIELKEKLPAIIALFTSFTNNNDIFVDLLGGNGPRKYLFLFQNNNEMRATGGFIGSYGLLDISHGNIRNFYIDGIFNPDGQLKEKIVPPKPIQKISAAWSLHDSNWFPDFPTSAQEAIKFFEKTGGPTTDGVITLTPAVMQKLLKITGPIEMPEYDVTLDENNFIEKTQYEVEVDYDQEENKPKKILSDLAPIILDKIFNSKDIATLSKALTALSEGLSQKHILIYSTNEQLQKIISQQGWSGEVLPAGKDYLSVINTNINGYKTDGVIAEDIKHEAEVQADGSIVDTVTVTRKHNGGNSAYEWWNKVNADYMRVYVPKGSKLLDVQGQTREFNNPPLDYDALGFKKDELVEREESSMIVDEQSGTRIYEDAGKTVFGNWVYVSPQETVTVTYKYVLPFKLFDEKEDDNIGTYSLVAQKQSGSLGSGFSSKLSFPKDVKIKWKSADQLNEGDSQVSFEGKLDVDHFYGLVLEKL
jgi:hypothetical protein